MKTLKKWGWWIVAGITALFIAIRLWMRFRAREKIIEEWTSSTTEHQEDIRKLEKQSKAQAKEAQEELNKIDDYYRQKKESIDQEIVNDQAAVANAWNRYFRAKRAGVSAP